METNANERELIEVMRRYFAAKAEARQLKARLEAARQAAGQEIDGFYNVRSNPNHAGDILRSHALRSEMVHLMDRAEAWSRAEIAAPSSVHSDATTPDEDDASPPRLRDAQTVSASE